MKINTAVRNALVDAFTALIDAGAAGGTIKIRTGSPPATPATAASGTLLATLTFSVTAFGAASGGTATAAAITSDTSADATGIAGWARIADSNGVTIADVSITGVGGGGDIEFDDTNFVAGGTVSISSMTITMPES